MSCAAFLSSVTSTSISSIKMSDVLSGDFWKPSGKVFDYELSRDYPYGLWVIAVVGPAPESAKIVGFFLSTGWNDRRISIQVDGAGSALSATISKEYLVDSSGRVYCATLIARFAGKRAAERAVQTLASARMPRDSFSADHVDDIIARALGSKAESDELPVMEQWMRSAVTALVGASTMPENLNTWNLRKNLLNAVHIFPIDWPRSSSDVRKVKRHGKGGRADTNANSSSDDSSSDDSTTSSSSDDDVGRRIKGKGRASSSHRRRTKSSSRHKEASTRDAQEDRAIDKLLKKMFKK